MAGGVLVEQCVEEQQPAFRDRRGVRHQRYFAEPAGALIGVEHFVQHFFAARSLGLHNAPFLEPHRDAVNQRTLIRKRLGADDVPAHPPRMRRGEHFLGRDVWIADDPVLGDGGAAHPFVAVSEPDGQGGAGSRIVQRAETVGGQPFRPAAQGCVVLLPCRDRVIVIDARGREDRLSKLCDRDIVFFSGEGLLCPGRVWIGNEVPVDVEIDDFLQGRSVGDRIGLAGARHFGGVLAGKQHRIFADDRKPRGIRGERLRHSLVKPSGGAVETVVGTKPIA